MDLKSILTLLSTIKYKCSIQFLSPWLDSLVKKLNKDDFKYLSHEFDNNVLDLVKDTMQACFHHRHTFL